MRDSQATAREGKRDDQAAAMRDSQAIAERDAQARRSGGCHARQQGDCKSRKERNTQVYGQAAAYDRQLGDSRSIGEKTVPL